MYSVKGEIPDLSTPLTRNLFNTYRAAAFPAMWPIRPQLYSDARGDLFEAVRSRGGTGMSYVSRTRPGQKRGEHYHLYKVERFVVVQGEAEINLRRLLHEDIVTFKVSGRQPKIIDMPTLWVHNIRNVGEDDLVTMFWSDQLLSQENPDQFPEQVKLELSA
jgi:UDP-2-acetamido-2,6-beta-L-arabino-hexul-4-ose reductase